MPCEIALRHAKTCLRAHANSEGPDQPVHPRSHAHIVKNLKNLLQNQESFKAESWCTALGTQGLPSSDDEYRLTFDFITARSNLHPHTKCM